MSIPKIDPYPPAPTPEDDEATFDEKAYEHAASLEMRRVQMNEVATYVNTRASDANNRAVAAAASATASANSATRSDEWANKAPGSVVASGKYSARHYSDLSDKFANAPEDVEVEPGKFSAFHWQEKAKLIANVHATTVATDPLPTVLATNVQEALRDLAYQSDQLRIAKNQLKYGDGPCPVLDLQFQGAKILDPRVTFTRASLDWDEEGNEYGVDEPVLSDKGLWVSGARTNLLPYSDINATNWSLRNGASLGEVVKISDALSLTTIKSEGSNPYAAILFGAHVTAALDTVYTLSAFFRKGESDVIEFRIGGPEGNAFKVILSGIASGAFQITPNSESEATFKYISGEVESAYEDVYRVAMTFSVKQGVAIHTHVNVHWEYLLETDGAISLGGFMLEEREYVTPLIPTNGSQVTVAYAPTHIVGDLFNDVYNPKQGTIYWEGLYKGPIDASGYYYFFSLRGEGSAALSVRIRTPDLILQLLQDTTATNSGEEVLLGDKLRFALVYDSKTFILYMNGVRQISGPLIEGSTSLFNRFQLGSYGLGGITPLHNYSFKYYNKSLPETTLQELTQ